MRSRKVAPLAALDEIAKTKTRPGASGFKVVEGAPRHITNADGHKVDVIPFTVAAGDGSAGELAFELHLDKVLDTGTLYAVLSGPGAGLHELAHHPILHQQLSIGNAKFKTNEGAWQYIFENALRPLSIVTKNIIAKVTDGGARVTAASHVLDASDTVQARVDVAVRDPGAAPSSPGEWQLYRLVAPAYLYDGTLDVVAVSQVDPATGAERVAFKNAQGMPQPVSMARATGIIAAWAGIMREVHDINTGAAKRPAPWFPLRLVHGSGLDVSFERFRVTCEVPGDAPGSTVVLDVLPGGTCTFGEHSGGEYAVLVDFVPVAGQAQMRISSLCGHFPGTIAALAGALHVHRTLPAGASNPFNGAPTIDVANCGDETIRLVYHLAASDTAGVPLQFPVDVLLQRTIGATSCYRVPVDGYQTVVGPDDPSMLVKILATGLSLADPARLAAEGMQVIPIIPADVIAARNVKRGEQKSELENIRPFKPWSNAVKIAWQIAGKVHEVPVRGHDSTATFKVRAIYNLGLDVNAAIDRFEVLAPGQDPAHPTIVPAWVVGTPSELLAAMTGMLLPAAAAAIAWTFDSTRQGLDLRGENLVRLERTWETISSVHVITVPASAAACPDELVTQQIKLGSIFVGVSRDMPVVDPTKPLHAMAPATSIEENTQWKPLSFKDWIRWHFDNPIAQPEKELPLFKKYEDDVFHKVCFALGGWPAGSRFPRTQAWLNAYYTR